MDVHPTEPWMLASLYNGNVHVWNFESQTLVKTFEVTDLPGMTFDTVNINPEYFLLFDYAYFY